MNILNCE